MFHAFANPAVIEAVIPIHQFSYQELRNLRNDDVDSALRSVTAELSEFLRQRLPAAQLEFLQAAVSYMYSFCIFIFAKQQDKYYMKCFHFLFLFEEECSFINREDRFLAIRLFHSETLFILL